jgi:sulfur relay (sulfurtransferase) complex TusBCD TusD component (DsrE family)
MLIVLVPADAAPPLPLLTPPRGGHRFGSPYAIRKRDMLLRAGLLGWVKGAAHVGFMIGTFAALVPSSLFAASSVTLVWDPSTSTNIAGYKVYYGPASRTYTNTLMVGNATGTTISNLITGATYYFTATAYDTFNLESDFSNEVGYTNVVLEPPIITLTSPANNSAFTAPATISLAANATANGHAITKVQFYSGTIFLGEGTNAPYEFTWSRVSAGNYSLTARLVYDAGATLDSTPAVNVLVAAPRPQAPPAVALISPANKSAFTEPATISLAADVTDNGHSITKVQFYNGATLLGEATNAPYEFTWTSVALGNYSLTAQAVYDSGSTVASTAAIVAVMKQVPPAIALTSPANNSAFTALATIRLAANVAANGHAVTKVQFYNGNNLLGEGTNAPYVFTWNSVAAGNYSLTAQAVYDSGSTVASGVANVTVTNLPPPAIVLTSPANNVASPAPATIRLAANVIANGHAISKVRFYNRNTLLAEDTNAPYVFTWSSVPAGNCSLHAQLVYDSGNTITSTAVDVTVTNHPPPTIALTSPANKSASTAPATISLAASVAANGHAITKVQFYNGATLLGEDTTAPYAFTWTSVAAGNYSLSARAVYDSGSTVVSTATILAVTKQVPPAIALTSPANNASFTAPATISLAANVTANGHPITKVQFYKGDTLLGEGTNAPYAFTWGSVPVGAYRLTARLVYDAGATLDSTPAVNVLVAAATPPDAPLPLAMDTLAPNLSTQSVTASGTYSGLFYQDDAVRVASAGSFTLSVTPRGNYSGHLQIGTNRYSFSGLLNAENNGATQVISRDDGPALSLDFQLGTGGQVNQVTGHLTDGTWASTLAGYRSVFGKGYPAPFAGNYTLVIPGYDANPSLPAGNGFGTLNVSSGGQVNFVGTLADGTKVSQSATVSGNGYWPLYLPLYSGNGFLMSWLAFASNTNSDLAGRLIWFKPADSTSAYYPGGFTCEGDAFGSVYLPTDPVLNLPDQVSLTPD